VVKKMGPETHMALLECQLQSAEERARIWEQIANAAEAEIERLRRRLAEEKMRRAFPAMPGMLMTVDPDLFDNEPDLYRGGKYA
jgi:hypothetical protein